ncbi:MAG: hypothetical protein JWM27_4049 [Gemmatimonadetes bacterium]|nr:hypothetical protein [Gemmatimonadota bacterium]
MLNASEVLTKSVLEEVLKGSIVVAIGLMFVFQIAATKRLTDKEHLHVRMLPPFGRKEQFTQEGWKYRKRAIYCQVVGVALMMIWWMMM